MAHSNLLGDVHSSLILLEVFFPFPRARRQLCRGCLAVAFKAFYSVGFRLVFPLPLPLHPFRNESQLIWDVVESETHLSCRQPIKKCIYSSIKQSQLSR